MVLELTKGSELDFFFFFWLCGYMGYLYTFRPSNKLWLNSQMCQMTVVAADSNGDDDDDDG